MPIKTHNPYIDGRKEWSDRYGEHITAKRNWQLATAACLAVVAVQAGVIGWQASQSSVQPYIVQVDELRQVVQVVPAAKAGGIEDPRILRAVVSDYIRNTRSILADPPAMKRWLDTAYAHSAPGVREVLNGHYRDNDPFELARRHTVAVDIGSVLPLSDKTYQVQWTETRRAPDGRRLEQTHWQGVVGLAVEPPRGGINPDNPLGIYVTSLHWTQHR